MSTGHTQQEARDRMQVEFINNWIVGGGDTSELTPVAYDNEEFAIPNTDTAWVRLNIQFNVGFQDSFGNENNRGFRREGFVFVQIHAPENQSMETSDILGRTALDIFDGKNLDEIHFINGTYRNVGNVDGFYMSMVSVEFQYEEIK